MPARETPTPPADGKDAKLAELEKVGRPLVDSVNRMVGEAGAEAEEPPGGESRPLIDALGVTPEHAEALLAAARAEGSPYKDMSAQDLADKLASDAEARADLERRAEAQRGAPKPKPVEVGGVSDTGVAAWPGSPAIGQPAMSSPSGGGAAKWPGG